MCRQQADNFHRFPFKTRDTAMQTHRFSGARRHPDRLPDLAAAAGLAFMLPQT